jgi:pyruvate formate lyase activating enzyme
MDSHHGTIFDIKKYAIHDGPGIRTTVFFQGCPLACLWCHNPESQSRRPVLRYRASRCALCGTCLETCPQHGITLSQETVGDGVGLAASDGVEARDVLVTDRAVCNVCGQCVEVCYHGARQISGREITVAEVIAEIERDLPFYDQSGGGVTFSGGEPLLQGRFLAALLKECKAREIHTVVDTSGCAAWDTIENILKEVDLFLFDLKLMDDNRHRKYTGVSNRLILGNLQRLAQSGAQILVRIPLIPRINDDPANLAQSAAFIAELPGCTGIELMAYHDIAASKYESLGRVYQLANTPTPTDTALHQAAEYFKNTGLKVKIAK